MEDFLEAKFIGLILISESNLGKGDVPTVYGSKAEGTTSTDCGSKAEGTTSTDCWSKITQAPFQLIENSIFHCLQITIFCMPSKLPIVHFCLAF
jgi:hypothetical protein